MKLSSKDRLAFYLPSLRGGGAERVTVTIANGLFDRGHAVDIVLTQAVGPYLAHLRPGIRVVDLDSRRVMASLPALVRYLCREAPSTVMTSMWHANIVSLFASRLSGSKARFIIREADTPSLFFSNVSLWQRRIYVSLMRAFYPMASAIVAPSEGVAADLKNYVGLSGYRINVVPNPVIHEGLFERASVPLDHPWFAEGAPPVVISVGRLGAQKDFSTLIRAFARVRAEAPARLMILGEGSERQKLEHLIQELGIEPDIALPGFAENPYPYLRRAAVYVLSSRHEGLPNALIEAMATGCPVVATDCPSGPREILADGRYGRLIPVGNVEQMSQALLETIRQPRHPYPEEALAPYLLDRVLDAYERLLLGPDFVTGGGGLSMSRSL